MWLWLLRAMAAALLLVGGDVAPNQQHEGGRTVINQAYHVNPRIEAVTVVCSVNHHSQYFDDLTCSSLTTRLSSLAIENHPYSIRYSIVPI